MLYWLIEDTIDQDTSYLRTASLNEVCRVRETAVKSRQTLVGLLFGNKPARMAKNKYQSFPNDGKGYSSEMDLARLD